MPLDAPVTIATLLNSLLTFTMIRLPVPPNVHRCELRLARMKISICAPYAKERFETARQHSILHPERIVGNSETMRLLGAISPFHQQSLHAPLMRWIFSRRRERWAHQLLRRPFLRAAGSIR